MGSYSDSTSELDEEFPVFDFLKSGRCRSQASRCQTEQPAVVVLDSSDTEVASSSPFSARRGAAEGDPDAGSAVADVMAISSSESEEEDSPYVPLSVRLERRKASDSAASSAASVKNSQQPSSNPPGPGVTALNSFSKFQWQMEEPGTLPQLRPPPNLPSWAGSATMSPSKIKPAKRTAAEIQASREEALRRREARERQQTDNQGRRLEQERQKAERKALAEAAKALRPDECMKHIVVVVDPALLQLEGGGTLLTSLQALGSNCAIEKQTLPRSVSWARRAPCSQLTGDVVSIPEANVVIQMLLDNFITLVHSYTQEQRGGSADCGPTLTSWVQGLQARNPDKILSLVVIDLEKYFRSQKSQTQKRFREAVQGEEKGPTQGAGKRRKKDGASMLPQVSRVEVEEALVFLQLHTGVQVRFLASWKDFSDHIVMMTKAVAEAPYKREKEKTGFSFYLESEWAGGHRVDKAGKGLLQVWKRQIQQLNRVSPDMASAILAAYPSPRLLKQAYQRCKTDREKISLLADLLIRRGEGVTSTTRRVGPELSKRLLLMMTSSDPQQTLDSASA